MPDVKRDLKNDLKDILEIQEYDMKMIRLMQLKGERLKELGDIKSLRADLKEQIQEKEKGIEELNKNITLHEHKILDCKERIKKLEERQTQIKKVEEFKALTQEMSTAERERVATEHATSDLIDQKNKEEEILKKLQTSQVETEKSSALLEQEILTSIEMINQEGKEFLEQRNKLAKHTNPDIFPIYERLLKNKKDRVIVPIENRTCTGCNITLTAHHENLVRRGERMIFCEHCSRILYWPETEAVAEEAAPKRRRRKTT